MGLGLHAAAAGLARILWCLALQCSARGVWRKGVSCLTCGRLSAQVLFAAQEEPALRPLVLRRFKAEGDVAQVGGRRRSGGRVGQRDGGRVVVGDARC